MKSSSLIFGMVLAVVVLAVLLLVFGVRFDSNQSAVYRAGNEQTMAGVVDEVGDFTCPVSANEMGAHLRLKTASGPVVVHLAPARIMRSQSYRFHSGDNIEVRGAPVRVGGADGMIAREITRGNEIITLRDKEGKLLLVQ